MISVVVPVFRNAASLPELFMRIRQCFTQTLGDEVYEILCVDDASDDGSDALIRSAQAQFPEIKLLKLKWNAGQVAAITAGLRYCKGNAAVVISADLQDPPELIPALVEAHRQGHEVVIAFRSHRADAWKNRLFSALFYRSMKLQFPQMPSGGFDYFLLSRSKIEAYLKRDARNRFLQAEVIMLDSRPKFLAYTRQKRHSGKSQWSFKRKMEYVAHALAYTALPMIPLFITAVGLGLIGALVLGWGFFTKQFAYAFLGLFALCASALIMALTMYGFYLRSILDELRHKPYFEVDSFP